MSAGAANTADGLVLVAAPLLAVQQTRDPLAVSLVTTAAGLPWLLASLHAGALADRLPRQHLASAGHALRAVTLLGATAATLTGHFSLPVLYAVVLLYGLGEVFTDTATQALVPSVVSPAQLQRANSRLVATETVGNNFLGAPLAGVLVGAGSAVTLAVPAVAYALAAALTATVRPRPRTALTRGADVGAEVGAGNDDGPVGVGRHAATTPGSPDDLPAPSPEHLPRTDQAPTSMSRDIIDGLSFLAKHPVLRSLAVLAGLCNLANGAYFALLVLWLVGQGSALGLSSTGYGLLAAALAAGAVAGSMATELVTGHLGARATMLTALVLEGVLMALLVAVPHITVIAVAATVLGAVSAIGNVLLVTTRQRLIPESLLGRVTSAYRLISRGTSPVGAAAGGALASAVGLASVLYACAALSVLVVALTARSITDAPAPQAE